MQPVFASAEQLVALCHLLLSFVVDCLVSVVGVCRGVFTLVEHDLLHERRGQKLHQRVELCEVLSVPSAAILADVAVERVGVHGACDFFLQELQTSCRLVTLFAVERAVCVVHVLISLWRAEAEEAAVQVVGVHERTEEYLQLRHASCLCRVAVYKLHLVVGHAAHNGVPALLRRHPSVSVAEQTDEERS